MDVAQTIDWLNVTRTRVQLFLVENFKEKLHEYPINPRKNIDIPLVLLCGCECVHKKTNSCKS